MSAYTRSGVLDGQLIRLRAVFTDGADNFIDATNLRVYIYDGDIDSDTIDAEIEAATFDSALVGPLTPTKIDTGFYELPYTVPLGGTARTWNDVWVADIGTTAINTTLMFTVINGADIAEQKLQGNQLIIIELDSSIADYQGHTLLADIQLSFMTTLSPYYASTDLVRMEIGSWIDFIPDSTLAMMIHWSSKEADFIKGWASKNADRLDFARAKFVSYDAVLRTMYLPGAFQFQPGGVLGTSKRLGDLSIVNGNGAIVARTSSGIDTETLKYIREQRNEWFRIVNAGGNIQPGQGLGAVTAVRNRFDPMRRNAGRQWADVNNTFYEQPGTNAKSRDCNGKGKFYWNPGQSFSRWGDVRSA